MWAMFIIACLVCVLDKTGFLLTDNLERLLYVEEKEKPSESTKETKQKSNSKEKKQKPQQSQPQDLDDLKLDDNELDMNELKPTKKPKGNPMKAEDALYEIKKAGR